MLTLFLKNSFIRSVYSGYLRGMTYEEIAVKLKLERYTTDEKTIDKVIDGCNAVYI